MAEYRAFLADPITLGCEEWITFANTVTTYAVYPEPLMEGDYANELIMRVRDYGRPFIIVNGLDAIIYTTGQNCDTVNRAGRTGTAVDSNTTRAAVSLPAEIAVTVRVIDNTPHLFYRGRAVTYLNPEQASRLLSAIITSGNEGRPAN